MTKWWSAIACVCAGVLAQDVPAPAEEVALSKADAPAVIDGALDEGFWKNAAVVRADFINSKPGVLSEQPRLSVKYAWDEKFLYIGYETFDANLVTKGKGTKDGPEENQREGCEIFGTEPAGKVDVVEFFISMGDPHFFWELHHNAANQFNDVWCVTPNPAWPIAKSSLVPYGILFHDKEFLANDDAQTVAMAVKLKPKADGTPSTLNDAKDADTGYTAEIRLPWGGLGAPHALRPDAKKKDGNWKIAGQKMMVLAVVQDGDLPERYHQSAALKKGEWFHKSVPLWPRYVLGAGAEPAKGEKKADAKVAPSNDGPTVEELATEIFKRIDQKESFADLIAAATDRGMAMAHACAAGLSAEKPGRNDVLYGLIAQIAKCRQSHEELLKVYDPVAHRTFYSEKAREEQAKFASVLTAEKWPRQAVPAVIQAAPLPMLEWLGAESAKAAPNLARLQAVWNQWGATVQFLHERQHVAALRELSAAAAKNGAIVENETALSALIRFVGEVGAAGQSEFVQSQCSQASATVRAECCRALQRLGGAAAPEALLKLAAVENEAAVLLVLGEALQQWPTDEKVGAAALALFERVKSADVRRAILFSAANATWSSRTELLKKALASGDDSVLGVALQAVAAKPDANAELVNRTLALATQFTEMPAPLIDALRALGKAEAGTVLVEALRKSKNTAIQLKLALALETCRSAEGDAELLAQLKNAVNPMLAQQLAAIVGRLRLAGADEVFAGLAEDGTAPLGVRIQCIWGLGAYTSEVAKATLLRLDADPDKTLGVASTTRSSSAQYEQLEQARMLVKMALLQQGVERAEREAGEIYQRGTPTTKIAMLMMLSQLKRDHAVIAAGLDSPEYTVVLAAVHAAGAAAAEKYRAKLQSIKETPFVQAILQGGMNTNDLGLVLDRALAAGASK